MNALAIQNVSLANLANANPEPARADAPKDDFIRTRQPKGRRSQDHGLPPGLRDRINTAKLLVEVLVLTEEQEALARDAVAMDWALARSKQPEGAGYAVLLRWGATLGTPSFTLRPDWTPERLEKAANRQIEACKLKAPERLKELLKDLRHADLVDDAQVARLLLG